MTTNNRPSNLDYQDSFIYTDSHALIKGLADWLVAHIQTHLQTAELFSLALSGGNTPKPLYELLATPEYAQQIEWERLHFFWSDERFVPHDHPQSNYHMTRLALFDRVPMIPQENIHPIPTDGAKADTAHLYTDSTLKQAAQNYAEELQQYYEKCYGTQHLDPKHPLFTVNLLGIGEDGHIASIFPGTPQFPETPQSEENQPWVIPVVVDAKPPPTRISLSLPVLESAATIVFLAQGSTKRSVIHRARTHDSTLPAGRIHHSGQLIWFLDQAAAEPEAVPEVSSF